jgi:hypothetical protein
MRASIIAEDNIVVVDGKGMSSDCSGLIATDIRVVQWYSDKGEVEYIGHVSPNKLIDDFSPYQIYIDQAEPMPEPEPMTPEQHIAFQDEYWKRHPAAFAALEKWQQQQEEISKAAREAAERALPKT